MTIKVLVRSKRDADAVKASLQRFPETSHWTVKSLGGVRGEKLYDVIRDEIEPFTVILLGKEDKDIYQDVNQLTYRIPFTAAILSRTKRIRNSTIEMINSLLTKARAIIRIRTLWDDDTYILSGYKRGVPIEMTIEPYGDVFFLYDKGALHALEEMGIETFDNIAEDLLFLVVKSAKGIHYIYNKYKLIGKIYMENRGLKPKTELYSKFNIEKINITNLIERNRHIIEILAEESKSYLDIAEDYDRIIVPISGGKDSAAALLLTIEKFNKDKITAVYVDTGIDFDENREYALKIADEVGVDLIITRAEVDKGLVEGLPLPSPENRWCTGRKLLALRKAIKEVAKKERVILVVGDRDSESDRRGKRPLLRVDQNLPYPTVAPLKLWSAAHVTLFLWSRGVKLNPLYDLGFYRTGCYLCYSLRSWELSIMIRNNIFNKIAKSRPHHKVFIERFLDEKSRVTGN